MGNGLLQRRIKIKQLGSSNYGGKDKGIHNDERKLRIGKEVCDMQKGKEKMLIFQEPVKDNPKDKNIKSEISLTVDTNQDAENMTKRTELYPPVECEPGRRACVWLE